MKAHLQHPVFSIISKLAAQHNLQVYAIGGFVRDIFLNRPSKDIDIVIIGNGITFAEAVAARLKVKLAVYKNFGTASLKYQDLEIEFVGARKESYRLDSRKPIVEDGTLEDDQKRRDLTINALAVSLHPETFGNLLDPFGGIADLEQKLIRTPLSPAETFSDDPLRMMRAIRFAAQLNFRIDDAAVNAIKNNTERISIISYRQSLLLALIICLIPACCTKYFRKWPICTGLITLTARGIKTTFTTPCRCLIIFAKPLATFGCAGRLFCMILPNRPPSVLNPAMAGRFMAMKTGERAWYLKYLPS